MKVRAVTPRVTAISGHLQFAHTPGCTGDCCNFDADQDDRAVGDPYDPEWPDKPLRLKPTRGGHVRPTTRRGHTPMHESADHRVSLDGRSALSPSQSFAARGGHLRRDGSSEALGGPPLDHPDPARAPHTPPPGARAGSGHLEDVEGARRSPGAP